MWLRADDRVSGVTFVRRWRRTEVDLGPNAHVRAGRRSRFEGAQLMRWHGELDIGEDCYWGRLDMILVEEGAQLVVGDRVRIDNGVRLIVRGRLEIGSDTYLGKDTVVVAHDHVRLGQRVLLGERVSIHDENHGPPMRRMDMSTRAISVGDDVWLGAGVVVTGGSEVGCGATIGANAVVTGRIPANTLAVGVPARVIRGV